MRTPWTIEQTEPGVHTVLDADGEEIWTVGRFEVEEARMVCEVVNGMAEALGTCERVFRSMADRGRYPLELLPGNRYSIDEQGFACIGEALRSVGREPVR